MYINFFKRINSKNKLNPIQPGMIWTVNYLGGVYMIPPPCISIIIQHIATKNYIQIKKNVFFLDMKLDFLCYHFKNNYRLKCDHKLKIVHKLTC